MKLDGDRSCARVKGCARHRRHCSLPGRGRYSHDAPTSRGCAGSSAFRRRLPRRGVPAVRRRHRHRSLLLLDDRAAADGGLPGRRVLGGDGAPGLGSVASDAWARAQTALPPVFTIAVLLLGRDAIHLDRFDHDLFGCFWQAVYVIVVPLLAYLIWSQIRGWDPSAPGGPPAAALAASRSLSCRRWCMLGGGGAVRRAGRRRVAVAVGADAADRARDRRVPGRLRRRGRVRGPRERPRSACMARRWPTRPSARSSWSPWRGTAGDFTGSGRGDGRSTSAFCAAVLGVGALRRVEAGLRAPRPDRGSRRP